jgi:ubiquinone/menaquinone biosynthesis C-methylase UbiE
MKLYLSLSHLINSWIPALDNGNILEELKKGAKVADVGCGFGITTLMMAKNYPNSIFIGFDFHKESIEKAKESAKREKINNVRFEVSSASDFPGSSYDFLTFFDCLHDMGDPLDVITLCRRIIDNNKYYKSLHPRNPVSLSTDLGNFYFVFLTYL